MTARLTGPGSTLAPPLTERVERLLRTPLFVVGAPRSGTTWLQQLLLEHPRVVGGEHETHFFVNFGPVLERFDRQDTRTRRVGLPCYWSRETLHETLWRLWVSTMRASAEAKANASLLVEKTPGHALHMQSIRSLLPGACFVHLVRDARAVAASMLAAHRSWAGDAMPSTARWAAQVWREHVCAARATARNLPANAYLEVRYEDLRRAPTEELQRVLTFVGLANNLDETQGLVEPYLLDSVVGAPPVLGARTQGFVRSGAVLGWKDELSWRQRWAIWRQTRTLLRQMGYGRTF